jgi:hypothetical protein
MKSLRKFCGRTPKNKFMSSILSDIFRQGGRKGGLNVDQPFENFFTVHKRQAMIQFVIENHRTERLIKDSYGWYSSI